MTSTIEIITPELAAAYLATFGGNRKRRPFWVSDLSEMMRNGTFMLTHQGLAFNTSGQLFDGQHRCLAIIEYGEPVRMMVTRGVNEEAWKTIDIGVKRSMADITGIDKRFSEPMRLAAVLLRGSSKGRTPHANEVIALYESPLGDAMRHILSECPTTIRYYSSSPMKLAAAVWTVKSRSQYAARQYAALVYQNYDEMSDCSKALSRQVAMQHTNSGDAGDSLARAYKVFDPSKSAMSKIQITENDAKSCSAMYRQDLNAIINGEDLSPTRRNRTAKP